MSRNDRDIYRYIHCLALDSDRNITIDFTMDAKYPIEIRQTKVDSQPEFVIIIKHTSGLEDLNRVTLAIIACEHVLRYHSTSVDVHATSPLNYSDNFVEFDKPTRDKVYKKYVEKFKDIAVFYEE